MLNHKQRSQVGLYIFILTATALALAGAGYLMGKDAPSWLETFIVAGMASLATAWRPGSVTDVAAVDAPAQPVEAQANPYLTAQQIPAAVDADELARRMRG